MARFFRKYLSSDHIFPSPAIGVALLIAWATLGCGPGGVSSGAGAPLDPEAMETRLTDVFTEPEAYKRTILLAAVLERMDLENAPAAGRALKRSELLAGKYELDAILSKWTALDARGAMDWAAGRTGTQARDGMAQVIFSWTALDGGKGAVEFLGTIPPEKERYRVVRNNIIKGLAASADGDWETANQLLAGISDLDNRQYLLLQMSLGLIRRDQQLGLLKDWVLSIPNDAESGMKTSAFTVALDLYSRVNVQSAAEWYDGLGLQPYKVDDTVFALGGPYVLKAPDEGFRWILAQPPSATRDSALRDAAYLLMKKQPATAFDFLREKVKEPEMAPAVFALAHFTASQWPEESLEWSLRIPHAGERKKSVSLAWKTLLARDKPAAKAWLEANGEHLSDDQFKEFNTLVQGRKR